MNCVPKKVNDEYVCEVCEYSHPRPFRRNCPGAKKEIKCKLSLIGNLYSCEWCHKQDSRPWSTPCPNAPSEGPSLLEKAFNFGEALTRHIGDGLKTRTTEEINELLVICQGGRGSDGVLREKCEHFINGACNQCGCPIRQSKKFFNKLAWRSEHCPVGKW
jgi:hypothetical protein